MLGPRKEPFYNRIAWVSYVEILLKVASSTINQSIKLALNTNQSTNVHRVRYVRNNMQMLRLTTSFRANIILFHTSIEHTVVCYKHLIGFICRNIAESGLKHNKSINQTIILNARWSLTLCHLQSFRNFHLKIPASL
jgi:hypothetical protein